MPLSLNDFLVEFGANTEADLMQKRIAPNNPIFRAMPSVEAPRRIDVTEDETRRLCDKVGLRYHPGYENRIIERVTTTETADRYGDIVRAKGIDNKNYRKNPVVLFAHNHSDFPVGKSVKEWIDNSIKGWRSWDLYFGNELDPTGRADITFRMVDSGAMPGGSIGFIPREAKSDFSPEEREKIGLGRYGVEYITCEKIEHSACSVPANPEALSNCLKSIDAARLKSMFVRDDVDRMVTEKMLDEQLADIFASILGVQRTVITPPVLLTSPPPLPPVIEEGAQIGVDYVMRPYPSEHAARVRDPDDFEDSSFRRKKITKGISIIIGKLKEGDGSMETQAYRFSVDTFTVAEAKTWLKDHDIKYISFEPATEGKDILAPVTVNLTVPMDISAFEKEIESYNTLLKAIKETLDKQLETFEARAADLIAATQRALAAMESRSRTVGLYDRKDFESVLRLPKK